MESVPAPESAAASLETEIDRLIWIVTKKIERQEKVRDAASAEITILRRQRSVLQSLQTGETPRLLGERLAKPAAILSLLREHPNRSFRLIDIRRELIRRGLMGSDDREIHALEVAARSLDQRGILGRTRRGTYRLARLAPAPDANEEVSAARANGARSP